MYNVIKIICDVFADYITAEANIQRKLTVLLSKSLSVCILKSMYAIKIVTKIRVAISTNLSVSLKFGQKA